MAASGSYAKIRTIMLPMLLRFQYERGSMEIYVTKDYQEMSEAAADIIADLVAEKPGCVLGLATGSTPEGLYAELVRRFEEGELDFSRVATFNLDEYRGLDPQHEQSYRYFMQKHLFDHVNVRPENTHVPNGANPDADAACEAYEASILLAGGIDLQLLGLGHNGHIGFNEPADEFTKETNCVDLTESTIQANSRLFNSADEVPRQAYTMGIGTIMAAKQILLVVSGEDKADIVREVFFGPVTPKVPASILQFHPNAIAVVDEAAFSKCGDVAQVAEDCGCGHHHGDDEECCGGAHEHGDEDCRRHHHGNPPAEGECCGKHHNE